MKLVKVFFAICVYVIAIPGFAQDANKVSVRTVDLQNDKVKYDLNDEDVKVKMLKIQNLTITPITTKSHKRENNIVTIDLTPLEIPSNITTIPVKYRQSPKNNSDSINKIQRATQNVDLLGDRKEINDSENLKIKLKARLITK